MQIVVRKYSVDPRPSYPLQILASRYTVDTPDTQDDGYTLIMMHATGMHKETWEPMIKRLFELSSQRKSGLNIQDVFSIECPNHGESAVLNESALNEHFRDKWSTSEYARSAYTFLTAGASADPLVDFSRRKLVGVGHSVGAAALFLMRDMTPSVKFHSIMALEPGISIKDLPETQVSSQALTAWTWLRRDVWPSRLAAKKELLSLPMSKGWDPRVLDLYVLHGLRKHPAAKYSPPFSFNGVTTALTKEQEAASYRSEELVVDALDAYTALTQRIPIHVILGGIHDVSAPGLQKLLSDGEAGRRPASIHYIDDAGHLIVQQKPDAVAEIVYEVLSPPKARL